MTINNNPDADFAPSLKGYSGQGSFRFWCQKVLPLVYDDSLSYYELLNKVVHYLNNTISDVANAEDNIQALYNTYLTLQGYVNDYFHSLDVQAEINHKLDIMATDGSLSLLITPYIPGAVSDWLSDNISPTTPIVDTTLTIQGAAAESKTVGDYFSDISGPMILCAPTPSINSTYNGVTIITQQDGSLKLYGTSTAARRILCLNGQDAVTISSTPFSRTLAAGKYQINTSISGYTSQGAWSYTYDTFTNASILATNANPNTTITFTDPVMIGFGFESGVNFGTLENPTILTFSASQRTAADLVARNDFNSVSSAVLYSPQSLSSAQASQAQRNMDCVGNDTLYMYNFYNAVELGNGTSGSLNGITYTKNSDKTWTIDGTATDTSFRNIINSASAIPRYIIPGRKYKFSFNNGTVPVRLYIYKNGNIDYLATWSEDFEFTFPVDMEGLILRFQIDTGGSYDNATVKYSLIPETVTSIDNYYTYNNTIQKTEQIINNTYDLDVTPAITTDSNGWLQSVDSNTSDETNKTDMTAAIMAMLNSTGYCHLSEGIFYVSGNIDMPPHSTLEGCGDKTIIRLLSSVSSGYCVKLQGYSTISNLRFSGAYTAFSPATEGTRDAIWYVANYDPPAGQSSTTADHCFLNNVFIQNFSGNGIRCYNTGISVSRGVQVSNTYIQRCYRGIYIDHYSEFNNFTNVRIVNCFIGCENDAGNNTFTSCLFQASNTGFLIDNSLGDKPNNSHGIINGCIFAHIGSNLGSAITINGIDFGHVISNCQIWYGSVNLTNSKGVLFSGCEFGRGTTGGGATINIDGGDLIMFNGCLFMDDINRPPDITISNNTKVKFDACYGSASGNLITGGLTNG